METIAQYALQVYKKGSFSKAAKELYISQPSLSAAIARLEKELGFRIFDRSTVPCSLTAEGRIYIESLEEILESEAHMQRRIRDLSGAEHDTIRVGGSSYAAYHLLPEICKEYYKRYPKVNVTLDIGNVGSSNILREKLENKEIDALVTYAGYDIKCVMEPICEERLVIAMHKSMRGAETLGHLAVTREEILTGSCSPNREVEDMSVFRDIPFLEYSRGDEVTKRMPRLLGNYKSSHYKVENARHSEIHYNLMSVGVGAAVVTSLAIAQKPYDENILFFLPKSEESYRKIFIARNPTSPNNPQVMNFIEVAKSLYAKGK